MDAAVPACHGQSGKEHGAEEPQTAAAEFGVSAAPQGLGMGPRGTVCPGWRNREVQTQGCGVGAGAREGWKHEVIGWSWRCVGVAVPEHRVGGCGSLLLQQGHWAQAELGVISCWHLPLFDQGLCAIAVVPEGLLGSSAIDWERCRGARQSRLTLQRAPQQRSWGTGLARS